MSFIKICDMCLFSRGVFIYIYNIYDLKYQNSKITKKFVRFAELSGEHEI